MLSTSTANKLDLYNNAPCGLISFDNNDNIVRANERMLSWVGISEQELLAKKFTDLLERGGKLYFQLFVKPMLDLHREANEISLQFLSSGDSFPSLFNAVKILNSDDDITHAAIYRISDRKKYELELLKKKSRAEEESQEKTKVLNEVAFNQAHLVRAPLANILALISLLDKPGIDEFTADIIGMLKESAVKLDHEIRTIVDKANF